ncbi:anti-sigma factor [Erythrobacter rubeus]|uniref:Anti-sigma factor n=1 Tax=Erythrobacter rubeus TaxID=2760803 RepID=A0ABR8KRT1_9SPHN|nr:anti-sigma factor [Erythrobacter rubeus]MBD2842654.1 anti-sigma factor [Erythrobacter rubeus]
MSDENDIERGDAVMAAEYALGLLEGEELLMARGRAATDASFAAEVSQWEERLSPLLDEVEPMVPSDELWARIEQRVDAQRAAQAEAELSGGGGSAANVVMLEHRVRRWQWTAALTSTAAAALFGFIAITGNQTPVIVPVDAPPQQMAAADPLVAQVPIGDTGLRLDVTYIPESERMLVGAIGLTADGVHDHELWLVPADGSALQSLGVVAPGEVRSMELPEEIARNLSDGAQLVLTREPIGGKPEGVDAGPVVAEGAFSQV